MTGNLLLELGEVEKAQHCLGRWQQLFKSKIPHWAQLVRAIVVCPEVGHSKYMTAAQLFPGTQSRDLYLKVRKPLKPLLLTLTILSGNRGTSHAALHCRDQVRALHSSRGSRRAVHDRPVRRGGGGRRGQEAHQPCNRGRSFQSRRVAGFEDNRKMSIEADHLKMWSFSAIILYSFIHLLIIMC